MLVRTRIWIAALAAGAAALALAGPASAATFRGTVVHRSHHARGFVLATRTGRLVAVHAKHAPRAGRVVRVRVRRLHNGTFAARHVRVRAHRRHARIRGTVSYVNRRRRLIVVSARGVSIVLHRARVRRAAAAGALSPGDEVDADVEVSEDGELDAEDVQQVGEDDNGIEIEGVVLAIDTTARTLTVSADEDEETGASVTVNVPTGFDMSLFQAGQEVELTVVQTSSGYQLVQSSDDDNVQEADDVGDDQGDQNEADSESESAPGSETDD